MLVNEEKNVKKQVLLNTFVNNIDMNQAVDEIEHMILNGDKSYVVAINVDVVTKIEKDTYLKKIVDEANMVLVDGKPLVWIAKWHKNPVKEKISGSDLVPIICRVAAQKGYSIFIIGGKEGVAEQAKRNLEKQYSDINVTGTYCPPFGFEKDSSELEKINAIINESKPDILLACLGCPKQEKWVYENYSKYGAKVSICAGATVDFIAGNIKRAPAWMSNHGLEWLYRMTKDPKRLIKRYLIDDLKIIPLIFKYRNKNTI